MIGRAMTSPSKNFTAFCAGPSALFLRSVTWPKSAGSALPAHCDTCWMESVAGVPGGMTGGENLLLRAPGSLPSSQTSAWLTSGSVLSFTSLPWMYV